MARGPHDNTSHYDIDTDFVVIGNGALEGSWFDERPPERTGSAEEKESLAEDLGIKAVGEGGWMSRSFPVTKQDAERFIPTGTFAEKRFVRTVMRGGRKTREPVSLQARMWLELDPETREPLASKGLVQAGLSPQGSDVVSQFAGLSDEEKKAARAALGIEDPTPEPATATVVQSAYVPTDHAEAPEEPDFTCVCGRRFDSRAKLGSHIGGSLRAEAKKREKALAQV